MIGRVLARLRSAPTVAKTLIVNELDDLHGWTSLLRHIAAKGGPDRFREHLEGCEQRARAAEAKAQTASNSAHAALEELGRVSGTLQDTIAPLAALTHPGEPGARFRPFAPSLQDVVTKAVALIQRAPAMGDAWRDRALVAERALAEAETGRDAALEAHAKVLNELLDLRTGLDADEGKNFPDRSGGDLEDQIDAALDLPPPGELKAAFEKAYDDGKRCGLIDGSGPGCIHEQGHDGAHSNGLRTWPNKPPKETHGNTPAATNANASARKERERARVEAAKAMACPACGAEPGKRCTGVVVDVDGKQHTTNVAPHKQRFEAAQKAGKLSSSAGTVETDEPTIKPAKKLLGGITVPCPTCGAKAGARCRDQANAQREHHQARKDAFARGEA